MLFFLFFLLLVSPSHAHFPDFCFRPAAVEESGYALDHAGDRGSERFAEALVGLGETLCYKVRVRDGDGEREVLYAVEFVEATQQYGFRIGYNFTVPIIDSTCVCHCPTANNICQQFPKYCNDDPFCLFVKATGQTPEGCAWVGGEGTACCQIRFKPDPDQVASVVDLVTFEPRLKIRITALDLVDRLVIETKDVFIDSSDGAMDSLDDIMYFSLRLDGATKRILPAEKYVIYNHHLYHFRGNKPNGLHDFDLTKPGWFKYGAGDRINFTKTTALPYLNLRTVNCGSSKIDVEFFGRYYSMDQGARYDLLSNLVSVEEYMAPLVEDGVETRTGFHARYVVIKQATSRRVTVKIAMRQMENGEVEERKLVDSVWLHDLSHLGDFSATIRAGKFGRNILEVHMTNVEGQVVGQVEGVGVLEDLTMTVPSSGNRHDSYTVQHVVLSPCTPETRVCLKAPHTLHGDRVCRNPTCVGFQDSFIPKPAPLLAHNVLDDFSYLRLSTWSHVGNPGNWFDGEYKHGELVSAIFYLLLIGIATIISLKIYRAVKKSKKGTSSGESPWPLMAGERLNPRVSRLESEGLDVFQGGKDVGFHKSLEDMLNDGSRSEDWNKERRRSSSYS